MSRYNCRYMKEHAKSVRTFKNLPIKEQERILEDIRKRSCELDEERAKKKCKL